MQVTLGEEGSGFSPPPLLFLPEAAKKEDALPWVRRWRVRNEKETAPPCLVALMGVRIDLDSFMEVWKRWVVVVVVAAVVALQVAELVMRRWDLFKSIFLGLLFECCGLPAPWGDWVFN